MAILGLLAVLTLAGLLLLWPDCGDDFEPSVSRDTERAEVVAVASGGCVLVIFTTIPLTHGAG